MALQQETRNSFGNGCVMIKTEPDDEPESVEDWVQVECALEDDNDVSFIDLTQNTEDEIKSEMTADDDEDEEKVDDDDKEPPPPPPHYGGHISFSYAPLPQGYPKEQTIVLSNLSPLINRQYLLNAFSQFGTITHIQKMSQFALIAFSRREEAQRATLANNLMELFGRRVGIRLRGLDKRYREYPSDQIAFVFDLVPHTPDEHIRSHFESCGRIIAMPYYRCANGISRILIFEKSGAGDMALKFDGSVIGQSIIRVKPRGARAENYIEGQTVVMFNVNGFTQFDKATIKELFSKCGEVLHCDVLCNIKKLAMITFKNEMAMEKAMKMSGTTVGRIKILLDRYTADKYKHTKIIVYNIAPGISMSKIADAFKKVALIDKIHYCKGRPFVLMEFVTTEDYCNAFRLDAENVCGRELVLKPFPDRDESLEFILYGREDWVVIWGDRPVKRYKRI